MQETEYGRRNRLRAEERSFALGMYGWNHPANIERARDLPVSVQLWNYCRLLEKRLRALEAAADRQCAADVAEVPLPAAKRSAPISIKWRRNRHG